MMNKNGMLGNVIGLFVILGIGFVCYGVIVEELDGVKEACVSGNNTSNMTSFIFNISNVSSSSLDCSIFEEGSLIGFTWDLIPLFFISAILLVGWAMFKQIWRTFDFDWTVSSSYNDNKDNEDNEDEEDEYKDLTIKADEYKDLTIKVDKKKYLKEPESKSKKSPEKIDKGVQWGSGVSWGEGVDKYGDSERRK